MRLPTAKIARLENTVAALSAAPDWHARHKESWDTYAVGIYATALETLYPALQRPYRLWTPAEVAALDWLDGDHGSFWRWLAFSFGDAATRRAYGDDDPAAFERIAWQFRQSVLVWALAGEAL